MLGVFSVELARQEEEIVQNEKEIKKEIQELHSRVTSNYKEIVTLISKHKSDDIERFHQLQRELSNRVGILEKWRWIIIGGSIVAGFILHKVIMFAI